MFMQPIFDELNLEKAVRAEFGLNLNVKSQIARVPVSPSDVATVFLTDKGLLFALIDGRAKLTLGDVKKIITRMNLAAEEFWPPQKDPDYFRRRATEKFNEVFPGRGVVRDDDLAFYKTLAPYSPALVQIAEVRDGVIKQFDTDAVGHWRPSVKFAYRRIRTS